YRMANTQGGAYFFTVVTYRRQRFLCGEMVCNALPEGIKATQTTHPFTIVHGRVLPDPLHCIWT
ncbi:MAG: transposase, partial [Methylophilaceae bacterium]|nr:transposase [Methylophilaceae bacterium]